MSTAHSGVPNGGPPAGAQYPKIGPRSGLTTVATSAAAATPQTQQQHAHAGRQLDLHDQKRIFQLGPCMPSAARLGKHLAIVDGGQLRLQGHVCRRLQQQTERAQLHIKREPTAMDSKKDSFSQLSPSSLDTQSSAKP